MRDIRRRIKTVRNIQQITKALKMVAAARLQRAEQRASAARPYAQEMMTVLGHLSGAGEAIDNPLMETREPVNIGILLITSDRGMAGSYNTSVLRKVSAIVKLCNKANVKLVTVGKKGRAFFSKAGYDIIADFPMPSSEITFTDARAISIVIREAFVQKQVDVVHIVFTRFYTAIRQVVTDLQVLPVTSDALGEGQAAVEEYMFEPKPGILLGRLLPRYVDVQVYRAMLESLASEHGARMTSMTSATDNAGEMIDRLTLDLNRARQAAITKELAEIVGGANALS